MEEQTLQEWAREAQEHWTTGPDGMTNSSPEFRTLVDVVEGLIRGQAALLIAGRTDRVAGLIMAQLAHKHDLIPRNLALAAAQAREVELRALLAGAADRLDWGAEALPTTRGKAVLRTACDEIRAALAAPPDTSALEAALKQERERIRVALQPFHDLLERHHEHNACAEMRAALEGAGR